MAYPVRFSTLFMPRRLTLVDWACYLVERCDLVGTPNGMTCLVQVVGHPLLRLLQHRRHGHLPRLYPYNMYAELPLIMSTSETSLPM